MTESDADLTADALAGLLPERPLRFYPAMLSTEADAMAWARSGGPSGAVVVAGYQASPRGRGGRPWSTPPGRSLGFSLLLRPHLPPEREGFPYLVACAAMADVLGAEATIAWPDTVRGDGATAELAVQTAVGPEDVRWVVVSCLVTEAVPPRGALLATAVAAIEQWTARVPDDVRTAVRARCETLGKRVRARIIPMGPRGVVVEGTATDLNDEGSLVIEADDGRSQPVRPQDLGVLELP